MKLNNFEKAVQARSQQDWRERKNIKKEMISTCICGKCENIGEDWRKEFDIAFVREDNVVGDNAYVDFQTIKDFVKIKYIKEFIRQAIEKEKEKSFKEGRKSWRDGMFDTIVQTARQEFKDELIAEISKIQATYPVFESEEFDEGLALMKKEILKLIKGK